MENACDNDEAAFDRVKQFRCDIELPRAMIGFLAVRDPAPVTPDDQRRYARRAMRSLGAIQQRETFAVLPRDGQWHKIYTKDVSRGGLSFLHSCQLYPRERIQMLLPDPSVQKMVPSRQPCLVEVARCRRLAPRCYEIGVFFVDELPD